MSDKVVIETKVLSENDRLAAEIRGRLQSHRIPTLNLVSSPGAGKTTLLEKTLAALRGTLRIGLVAGDVQTENDAQRLVAAGGYWVKPIVTGGACHLDARMVAAALADAPLSELDLLIIENVGNLVCPSSYDLGEDMKVVLLSSAEGDDKPLKYPAMFRRAALMVLTKMDLLGLSDFDADRAAAHALRIHPDLLVMRLSCRSGEGLTQWFEWLQHLRAK